MRENYQCKNLGVEEGEGHIFKGGLLAEDYGTCVSDHFRQICHDIWSNLT